MKLFVFLVICFFSILARSQNHDCIKFKSLINSEVGFEISYPGNWFIKTKYRPTKGDSKSFENISFDNTEEEVVVAGGGPMTIHGTSFQIEVLKSTAKDIEEQIKQDFLSPNQETQNKLINKRLAQVVDTVLGGQNLKVWRGKGWADAGVGFIYQGKWYRIHFMSGSKEQFLSDFPVYEKMMKSFKLNN